MRKEPVRVSNVRHAVDSLSYWLFLLLFLLLLSRLLLLSLFRVAVAVVVLSLTALLVTLERHAQRTNWKSFIQFYTLSHTHTHTRIHTHT